MPIQRTEYWDIYCDNCCVHVRVEGDDIECDGDALSYIRRVDGWAFTKIRLGDIDSILCPTCQNKEAEDDTVSE